MDDILVLAPTRWKLRKAVKVVNRGLTVLGLRKHPDKTFIGRVTRGFDWLGYHINLSGLRVATQTLERFVAHVSRLYEQQLGEARDSSILGAYVQRWIQWVKAGLSAWGSGCRWICHNNIGAVEVFRNSRTICNAEYLSVTSGWRNQHVDSFARIL